MTLKTVLNPFGRALDEGLNLNAALGDDPTAGSAHLDRLCQLTLSECASAQDGVRYRLIGADPRFCTPMQYGGFYLERDREILAHAKQQGYLEIDVDGDEPYLDFIVDLPCDALKHNGRKVEVTHA